MAYRIAVLDDDLKELHKTEEMLFLYGEEHRQYVLEIMCFQEMKPFMDAVCGRDENEEWTFDILLMDVYLPDGNGIKSAKILREKGYEGIIIFKSSSRENAIEAYSVNALHYLVKPVSQEQLDRAMEKAVAEILRHTEAGEEKNVQLTSGTLYTKVPKGSNTLRHMINKMLTKWNERFSR